MLKLLNDELALAMKLMGAVQISVSAVTCNIFEKKEATPPFVGNVIANINRYLHRTSLISMHFFFQLKFLCLIFLLLSGHQGESRTYGAVLPESSVSA